MEGQYRKLIDMLSSIVIHAGDLSVLSAEIKALAGRHQHHYHVRPEHYAMVGEALLFTLEKGLGNEWNEPVQQAWVSCYSTLAGLMMEEVEEETRETEEFETEDF